MHWKLCSLLSAVVLVWYMCQFNAVEIKGDPISKGMLIGLAQVFGCLFVSKLADLMPDYLGVIIGYCIMLAVSSVM